MTSSTDTRYDFRETETRIYKKWRSANAFAPRAPEAKPYTIVIPPPNVTGRLHMGHALNNTIQDMLIRFKRMDGFDALWIPGTDHAGIATQTVVKKMLDAEGIDYRTLGREKFIEKVWEWKEKYGSIILNQLERLGASCDWSRLRFTLDEGLSKAVTHTFKKLYDDGLIYRGKRIVNWCPVDRTALSDDEIETKEGGEPGFLWQIKYVLEDGSDALIVATTRPETLFGDVAVAIHPDDERYQKYIGKKVIVPLQGRLVPIIADSYVDKDFGTGCLKITPAHDPNDFDVAARHGLTPINIMHEDATMNDVVPERYRGLARYKCRTKAIEELKEKELLVSEEARMTPLGRSYRSGEVIEYRLSDQWFVTMKPLVEKVLNLSGEHLPEAGRQGSPLLNIQPERWRKVYLNWLNNIRDWCISRQLWWGHRIPAYYCKSTMSPSPYPSPLEGEGGQRPGEGGPHCPPIVSETTPTQCPNCGSTNLTQDNDVLDTWFSSALWPMSTLGWPEKTPDFERYFPTTTLVTGKDIIFFWVARMNFMAVHFTGKLPYKNVFINPIVLDEKGETMSKSKGNGIDPLVVIDGSTLEGLKEPVMEARPSNMKEIIKRIEKNWPRGYEGVGADALRYTLIYLCSSGQQLKISMDAFHDLGRRFMTKLWNAARFLFMYIEQEKDKGGAAPADFTKYLTDEDHWIRARLQITVNKLRACYDDYDFTNLGQTYYRFFWNDYCDWYVELAKTRLTSTDAAVRKSALHNLTLVFADALRLLHPLIPHITEELWTSLNRLASQFNLWGSQKPKSELLVLETFPKARELSAQEQGVLLSFECLQNIVTQIRTLRKTYQIKDAERLSVDILPLSDIAKKVAQESSSTICRLAGLSGFSTITDKSQKKKGFVTVLDTAFEIALDVSGFIDVTLEKTRLAKEMEKLEKGIQGLKARLTNENFMNNADPEIVQQQKNQLAENEDKLSKNKNLLSELETMS